MSTRAQTELHTKEMKKRKKWEIDRRYRQNKKVNASLSSTTTARHETAVQETKNQLAMTVIENENLKRAVLELRLEIFHLTSQRQFIEQRFNTIYTELEKEIECVRAAAEGFGEQRGMTLGTGIPSRHSMLSLHFPTKLACHALFQEEH